MPQLKTSHPRRILPHVCRIVYLATFLAFAASCANASPDTAPVTSAPWTAPIATVPFCAKPPKIDGALDDAAWVNAAHVGPFYRLNSPVTQQTEAWICADHTHLYIAFHCFDSSPKDIRATETQRDGATYLDDYVAVDLDSQDTARASSEFVVTARGTQSESLEAGTADNITWAGDWHAATKRTADGWAAEMSIPFELMQYPKGAHDFGVLLRRKLARETSDEYWPDMPPDSLNTRMPYYGKLAGLSPVPYREQPIFLPYVLANAGEGSSLREGMDIKYRVTPTETAVATLYPDFASVEQDVTSINFSYTQKYVNDRRPFFAEGSSYAPYSDIYYSPNVGGIDEGVKFFGKQNGFAFDGLATNTGGQRTTMLVARKDIGLYSDVNFNYASDNETGLPENHVGKAEGYYSWRAGQAQWSAQTTHISSWLGGVDMGGKDYYKLGVSLGHARPTISVDTTDIGPNITNRLGYLPEVNMRGGSASISQGNTFDKGLIQYYNWTLSDDQYAYHTGGFYKNQTYMSAYANTHSGYGAYFGVSQGQFEIYHDHVNEYYVEWGNLTIYAQGWFDQYDGEQDGQHYEFTSVQQGLGVTRQLSVLANYNRLVLGDTTSIQTVGTGTLRLDPWHAVGTRIVSQDRDVDIYISFTQKSRAGTDLFLLFGDPNSPRTRGAFAVKVVRPF